MADALTVLREAIQNNVATSLKDTKILIGNKEFDKDAPTAWQSAAGGGRGVYTIGAIWFCYQHRDLSFGLYLRNCSQQKFPTVSLPDRKPLIQYLDGEIDTHPNILVDIPDAPEKAPERTEQATPVESDPVLEGDILQEKATFAERLEEAEKRAGEPLEGESAKREFDEVLRLMNQHIQEQKGQEQTEKAAKHIEMMRQMRSRRYDQEHDTRKYWEERIGKEVEGIDTTGTMTGMKPRTEDLEAVLDGTKAEQLAPSRHPQAEKSKRRRSHSGLENSPIIIIPSALKSSLINIFNAKELLEGNKYTNPEMNMSHKPQYVRISRNTSEGQQVYRVFDSALRLRPHDWANVVAVFVAGQAWQFKGWAEGWQTPVDIFAKVPGFYLHFDDTDVPAAVKSWSVHILTINRNRRHLDATAVRDFWAILDKSMEVRGIAV